MNHCVKWPCSAEKRPLVRLGVGDTRQTSDGFLIVKVGGWYCPICGGSYGDFEQSEATQTSELQAEIAALKDIPGVCSEAKALIDAAISAMNPVP